MVRGASLDNLIVVSYVVLIVVLGFVLRRRAGRSLEHYFLAGRKLPWWLLSLSGAVSSYDITGTMWIVSLMFVIGVRSMWVHWMWGVITPAFGLAYTFVWLRRSRVVTQAEWMAYRFGSSGGGRAARLAYAMAASVFTASMIAYAFQGIGKFASVYLPLSPHAAAGLVIGVTAVYVIFGGVYSVIWTDLIQTILLTLAAVVICWLAFTGSSLEAILARVPDGWDSLVPLWRPEYLGETAYHAFGALCLVWIGKGLILSASGPDMSYTSQRVLSARSAREAGKLAAIWPTFLVSRWAMSMGITVLALVGFSGIADPERVLPLVLRDFVPAGLRGLIIAGFLAAFMSTFDSTINSGAAYVVRDIYQAFLRPRAGAKELVYAGYAASALIVIVGCGLGLKARSIASVWNWIMMALGAGLLLPDFLKWYWWRFNGWGYMAGSLTGTVLSLGQVVLYPETPIYAYFPVIGGLTLLAGVVVALATRPAPQADLVRFYRETRPWGVWGPVRGASGITPGSHAGDTPRLDIPNAAVAVTGLMALYLAPVYLMIHAYERAAGGLGLALAAAVTLYRTWYKNLPDR